MSLTPETRKAIAGSGLFLCLVPVGGVRGDGLAQLEYAWSLGKPVLYWVPEGRDDPAPVEGYPGVVVRGPAEKARDAIKEFFETRGPVETADGGYD